MNYHILNTLLRKKSYAVTLQFRILQFQISNMLLLIISYYLFISYFIYFLRFTFFFFVAEHLIQFRLMNETNKNTVT